MKKNYSSTLTTILLIVGISTVAMAQKGNAEGAINEIEDLPKESPLNTAALTTSDGKTFKLTLVGDRLPLLSINGYRVSQYDLDFYTDTIEKLSRVIAQKQVLEDKRKNAARERIRNQLIIDLVQKKVVANMTAISSYYLTSRFLKVNGKVQDPDMFLYFRNKYVTSEDAIFYYESSSNYSAVSGVK